MRRPVMDASHLLDQFTNRLDVPRVRYQICLFQQMIRDILKRRGHNDQFMISMAVYQLSDPFYLLTICDRGASEFHDQPHNLL